VLDYAPPLATLRVVCSKGTYIRTLCHDLGAHLGCGGHLAALRRTRCGPFAVEACTALASLEQLAAAGQPLPLIPLAEMLPDWPSVEVLGEARQRLAHGVAPAMTEVTAAAELPAGQPVRLLVGERLAAVARFAPGGEGGRRGDFILDKVFLVA